MPLEDEKLLDRIKRSKKDLKRKDIENLYISYGFLIEHGAKHDKVKHPDFPEIRMTTLPRHVRVHEEIVRQAIRNIELLIKLRAEKADENE